MTQAIEMLRKEAAMTSAAIEPLQAKKPWRKPEVIIGSVAEFETNTQAGSENNGVS
jgi:hypothetical protein